MDTLRPVLKSRPLTIHQIGISGKIWCFILNTAYSSKIHSVLIAERICRAAAITSLARTTDFAADLRPMNWLITHPSKVKFTTDTMTVITVLKPSLA